MHLKLQLVSLVGLTLASFSLAGQRPNILWIIAEDASPDIGPYGEKLIKTPAFDRLAREGITFTQAFTTAPVCSPSRSALIAGMEEHAHGDLHDDVCLLVATVS